MTTAHEDLQRLAHNTLDHNLTNHRPTDDAIADIETVREALKAAGHTIIHLCPNSRERSLALTALEETTMWAVAAIARVEVKPEPVKSYLVWADGEID